MTAAVFWPACDNGFVNLDDNSYVCTRPEVLSGISWRGLRWTATANVVGNWHPLTMLSLQTDAQFFGPGPAGFHRTAVLIHAANAALVFLAIRTLTGCPWRSVLVAALFALHPLRVESVAWISERKDVLSGFFFCLTILTYAHYARRPSFSRYALVAICLALGLAAKSMLVTTPCVLLLIDYWPLARIGDGSAMDGRRLLRVIAEKIPLLALVGIISTVTVGSQTVGMGTLADFPLGSRIANAIVSCGAYLSQTFWPAGLSLYYAYHDVSNSAFQVSMAGAVLVAITVVALLERRRRPYLIVGWLWFLGMLVPVLGLVQVGNQTRADRYTYLPHSGLFLAVVWLGADLVRRSRRATVAMGCAAGIFLTGCVVLTERQIPVWRNSESLWRRVYALHPADVHVIKCLITCLMHTGKNDEALELTREKVRVADESDSDMMVMLAMLSAEQGEHEACEQTLTNAIRHTPRRAELYSNRGKARAALAHWEAAADDFRAASDLAPGSVSYRFYLAHALAKMGNVEDARKIYATALRQSPQWTRNAAMDAWRMSTSADPAARVRFWPICLAEQALEATNTKPNESPAPYLDVLAAAYADNERFEEAIATEKLAIELAEATRQSAAAQSFRSRLELYRRHEPFRDVQRGLIAVP